MNTANIDPLLDAYVQAAILHRDATATGDYRAVNRAAKTLEAICGDLRARGTDGEDKLLSLLEHEDPRVRGMAAADVLDFAPKSAVPVLESLVDLGGLIGLSAEMVLRYRVKKQ